LNNNNNSQKSSENRSSLNPICPLCSGDKIKKIGKPQICEKAREYVDADYLVMMCKACKYYFVYPKISFTRNQWAGIYGKEYFVQMTRWWFKKRAKHRNARLKLIQSFKNNQIERFLDVGCGEGYVLLDALKNNWETYGLDMHDYRIDAAKNKKIKFIEGDISSASLPDNFFDIIYLDSVLEHIIDTNLFLDEIRRITKANGLIYVGVPNEDCLGNWGRKLFYVLKGQFNLSHKIRPFKSPFHIVGFTRKSLSDILKKNNFEILYMHNFGEINVWRSHKLFSRPFFLNLGLVPLQIIALLLGKSIYLEAVVKKKPDVE